MAGATPQQAAQNWATNLSGATARIKAGVQAVTTAPTASAAAAIDRYQAGVIAAVQSGKTQRALQSVSLADWQNAMINKGVARIASGAQQAQPKVQAFLSQFLPYVQSGVQQLATLPRGDLEANIARASFMMRWNAGFKYNKGS